MENIFYTPTTNQLYLMQDSEPSEKSKNEHSDGKIINVEYIPLKKRRIFNRGIKLNNDGTPSSDAQGRCKNMGFSPMPKIKETQGQSSKEYKEEEREENRIRRRSCSKSTEPTLNQTKFENNKEQNIQKQEELIINDVTNTFNFSMLPVKERSQGVVYESPMQSLYRIPTKFKDVSIGFLETVRGILFIDVVGSNVPPPILKFEDMRLPRPILKALRDKKIFKPTKIQMQGIPAVLLGRDIIGISSTGSGKTLVFVLPMIMQSWEMELRMPIKQFEGPFGLVLSPSRELASQINDVVEYFTGYIRKYEGPRLDSLCVIGGTTVSAQQDALRSGVHMVVATPGRLNDLLNKKVLNLTQCRFLCFDEADRLIDQGFEEELGNMFNNFTHQRQTLLFSATMPKKIQEFARSSLVQPIVVNVGLSGSANKNVKQEVLLVQKNLKLPTILKCLKKTPPPVLIFCENKVDVDNIHEYLLLKELDVTAIHGGLSQEERTQSILNFKKSKKDVLIGTDVASKGLDFPSVQHVINFDLPRDIENYVHRIGRTGRRDEKGLATTLLDGTEEENLLKNLKSILIESNQEIPEFLDKIYVSADTLKDIGGLKGCAFCGALGHRIANCPKLENERNKKIMGYKDDEME